MKKFIFMLILMLTLLTLVSCVKEEEVDLTNDINSYLESLVFEENYDDEFIMNNKFNNLDIIWEEVDSKHIIITKLNDSFTTFKFSKLDVNKHITLKASVFYKEKVISKTYSFMINKEDIVEDVYYEVVLGDNLTSNDDNLDKVLKDKVILINILVPDNVETIKLFINDKEYIIEDDTYSLKVVENTTVSVEFTYTKNYYKVTLGDNLSSNNNDLDNVLEGTEVVLTINVPDNVETIKLFINDKEIVVTGDTYTLVVVENTTVSVEFTYIKNYYKVTLGDNLSSNNNDLDNVLEGTELEIFITVPENIEEIKLIINGVEFIVTSESYLIIVEENTTISVEFTYAEIIEFKPIFKLDEGFEIEHTLDKVFTPPVLEAYDHDGDVEVVVFHNPVDINKEGTYYVLYQATNKLGTTDYSLKVVVKRDTKLSYYDSITAPNSNPKLLISQLRTLISDGLGENGSGNVTYGDIRQLLIESDVDLDNTTRLRGIYKEEYFKKSWDAGATWNREHVWPQSRLYQKASNSARNQASDAHNLRVIGTKTNSDRGNDIFTNTTVKGSTYFPSNRDKGDVARIMLYMVVRYENLSLDIKGGNLVMGDIRVFNDWHLEDPVDNFEIQRNNVIEDWQGNRNPFIDNPEWFTVIWEHLMSESGIQALEAMEHALEVYERIIDVYVPNNNDRREYSF